MMKNDTGIRTSHATGGRERANLNALELIAGEEEGRLMAEEVLRQYRESIRADPGRVPAVDRGIIIQQ